MLKSQVNDNYRIYGVSLNGYDCDDITCDVLSNVRGRFFITEYPQKDTLVKNGDNESIKYIYSMEKNRPLFWRVYNNSELRETSHKNGDGSYYVETLSDKGASVRKVFFSAEHQWLRAEYCNVNGFNGEKILISSGFKDGQRVFIKKNMSSPTPDTLYKCDYDNNPEILEKVFLRNVSVDVSVFSNEGLEYYADSQGVQRFNMIVEDIKKEIAEEKADKFDITPEQAASGFNFKPEYFQNTDTTMDIRTAQNYGEQKLPDSDDMYEDSQAYHTLPAGFEKIKINSKPVETEREFIGEISIEEKTNSDVIFLNEPVKIDESEAENNNLKTADKACEKHFGITDSLEAESQPEDTVINPWKEKCDMTLNLGSEVYRYYGETNSRNERNGYGRTEQPNGRTAYEGEYFKDRREGFGVHYYKDDGLSYAGTWKNNKREGMGVGFKSEDGSVLAGKWSQNKPQGVCVKFDKDGNVTYYGKYTDGKRDGFSVVFREDGVLEIVKWKNDEKSPLVREIDLKDLI